MTNYEPDFCGYCGSELADADLSPGAYFCEDCDQYVFHSPTPGVSVTVVDGERVLLIQRGVGEDAGQWGTPAGHVDWGEGPDRAAARELEEETGLSVDRRELTLVAGRGTWVAEGKHMVGFEYAVHRDATDGVLEAGSDAQDVRFWSADEWRDSGGTMRDVSRKRYGTTDVDEIVAKTLDELE
ncbi:NUDIX domain-containing protein [Halosimplex salinum]|uniref:NUDIX domain-containing protein n=1 Tax=Halosimplex salinum TaxID=1710538 RepID=UPI000F499F63|nr:NUDIX domain-containing protein [Halosimplex salinum]